MRLPSDSPSPGGLPKKRLARRCCPICACASVRQYAALSYRVFDDCGLDGDVALVACGRCGFAYNDVGWAVEELARYYRHNGYYGSTVAVGAGGDSDADRVRYRDQVERIVSVVPDRAASVVDVGCGRGGLLGEFARQGYTNLLAVDPSPRPVESLAPTRGLRAEIGSADRLPVPDGGADLLLYSHVLEHVLDLQSVLSAIDRTLAPGGVVYVEVPDAAAYGQNTGWPYSELYFEHINHFDMSSLCQLFESRGLRPLTKGTVPLVDGTGRVTRCLYALFKRAIPRPVAPGGAMHGALTAYVSDAEAHPVWRRLQELAGRRVPVYLWGISQVAMLLMGRMASAGWALEALLDSDPYKQTKRIDGMPIVAPAEVLPGAPGAVVVVPAAQYVEQISKAARAYGFHGPVVALS